MDVLASTGLSRDNMDIYFTSMKPCADRLMNEPSQHNIEVYLRKLNLLRIEFVQLMHHYLLFPLLTHLSNPALLGKYEQQQHLLKALKEVLSKVEVNKISIPIQVIRDSTNLIYDFKTMKFVANVPEELKLDVTQCNKEIILRSSHEVKLKYMKEQYTLMGAIVFVSAQMAKNERLRALRIASIECLLAHTFTHEEQTNCLFHIMEIDIETVMIEQVSKILPGVLAALQDVAVSQDNPGHAVVTKALEAIHRIACVIMNDKHMPEIPEEVSVQDFLCLARKKMAQIAKGQNLYELDPKNLPFLSEEWYLATGHKLTEVMRGVVVLRTDPHFAVRLQLALLCRRIVQECSISMRLSVPLALDVILTLQQDSYPEVANYCGQAMYSHLANAPDPCRIRTLESIADNYLDTLFTLPRIMNNVDSSRKLSALNLVLSYVRILAGEGRPQRLTTTMSSFDAMQRLLAALLETAALDHTACDAQLGVRDVSSPPLKNAPWIQFRHLDDVECPARLRAICEELAAAECAELVLDVFMQRFEQNQDSEMVCVMNWMGAAPRAPNRLAHRIVDAYLQEEHWYAQLEPEEPKAEPAPATADPTVYNPRAWMKDSVLDLYEGTVETRYTDITYLSPASRPPSASTLGWVRKARTRCCLLAEGVGLMAEKLGQEFQPYLLSTLCMMLERVGSKFEMLHQAGLQAMHRMALAEGASSAGELIANNADYFTSQITKRLKREWTCQSALEILSVVMEYCDENILDCLYGIVEDVLVQSCDKFHDKELVESYLQVFMSFVVCIRKWFPPKALDTPPTDTANADTDMDFFKEVVELENHLEEVERLMKEEAEEFEQLKAKGAKAMYEEDQKRKEEEMLDYDDTVSPEKAAPPHYIEVTLSVLKRCIHFVTSKRRRESLLAMLVLTKGLPIPHKISDDLLPLIHQAWEPLVTRFECPDPVLQKRALDLLLVMGKLSKDFINSRTMKEVIPHLYKYLHKASKDSYLKDVGSAYRNSQAFQLQVAIMEALPPLAEDLMFTDEQLEPAMACFDHYLSNRQPKPLQALAVKFYKRILKYCYGTTWVHLKEFCNNNDILEPPSNEFIELSPVVGTPYRATNLEFDTNVKLIFDIEDKKGETDPTANSYKYVVTYCDGITSDCASNLSEPKNGTVANQTEDNINKSVTSDDVNEISDAVDNLVLKEIVDSAGAK